LLVEMDPLVEAGLFSKIDSYPFSNIVIICAAAGKHIFSF
jgi:hypothetical protein